MAEIRLDRCVLSKEEIEECFSSDIPTVATCRVSEIKASDESLSDANALKICESRLSAAIRAGADYVDIECDAPGSLVRRVCRTAAENGTMVIRSYHDFNGTPPAGELSEILAKCRADGADIVKIATAARSGEDVDAVLSLYDRVDAGVAGDEGFGVQHLIAFCMGDAGRASRIECLRRGAPFTYASVSADEAAAPGQYPAKEMMVEVYGTGKFTGFGRGRSAESGGVRMPSSKSFVQRAIISAALAGGVSNLRNYTPCGDSDAAVEVARILGASVEITPSGDGFFEIKITGAGVPADSALPKRVNVGESGLLARLMIPLAARLSEADVIIDGEKTLLRRPLDGAAEMMSGFGVTVCGENVGESDSGVAGKDVKVPLKVSGTLSGGRASVDGKYGSQLISGLLMALPLADRNSTLAVSGPKSIPYLFMTVEVLKRFGIKIGCEMSGGRDFMESDGDWERCREITFKIKGNQKYSPADLEAEGDWSAAANFLVAGAIFGRAVLDGLDTSSLQADIAIMDILAEAGASLSQFGGNQGTITAQRAPLFAFSADVSNCPDLFPILSVLAAFCHGTSRIAGIDRLAHKESDRGRSVMDMLTRLGVGAEIVGNEFVVEGQSLAGRCLCGNMLKGGDFPSFGDHRMVMALRVAALGADGPVNIAGEECVSKSFPGFSEMFGAECLDK